MLGWRGPAGSAARALMSGRFVSKRRLRACGKLRRACGKPARGCAGRRGRYLGEKPPGFTATVRTIDPAEKARRLDESLRPAWTDLVSGLAFPPRRDTRPPRRVTCRARSSSVASASRVASSWSGQPASGASSRPCETPLSYPCSQAHSSEPRIVELAPEALHDRVGLRATSDRGRLP